MKTSAKRGWGLFLATLILLAGTLSGSYQASAVTVQISGQRPYSIVVPDTYSPTKPAPLVILLHSYGGSGEQMVNYLQFKNAASARGIIYVAPDGTQDSAGKRFWNATPGCCNFGGSKIDDTLYISEIINKVQSSYVIDQNRIYILGHSNGGFMSQNLGCNLSGQVAGIVSIAGEQYADSKMCNPVNPINVLQVQGTSDATVPYIGGSLGLAQFPGALQTVQTWAEKNKCNANQLTSTTSLSLVSQKLLPDTKIITFESCALGSAVELWSIDGAGHVPIWNSNFMPAVLNWVLGHPKPIQASPTPTPTTSPKASPTASPQVSKSSTPKPTLTPKKVTKVVKKKIAVKPTPKR